MNIKSCECCGVVVDLDRISDEDKTKEAWLNRDTCVKAFECPICKCDFPTFDIIH